MQARQEWELGKDFLPQCCFWLITVKLHSFVNYCKQNKIITGETYPWENTEDMDEPSYPLKFLLSLHCVPQKTPFFPLFFSSCSNVLFRHPHWNIHSDFYSLENSTAPEHITLCEFGPFLPARITWHLKCRHDTKLLAHQNLLGRFLSSFTVSPKCFLLLFFSEHEFSANEKVPCWQACEILCLSKEHTGSQADGNLYIQLYLNVSIPSYKGITHPKGSGCSGSKVHRVLHLPCSDAPCIAI